MYGSAFGIRTFAKIASSLAEYEAADRFKEGVAADRHELIEMLDEGRRDRARGREQELLDAERAHDELPEPEDAHEHCDRGHVVTDAPGQLAATSAAPGRPISCPRSRSRTRVMKPK